MALTILDDSISSDRTWHTARLVPGGDLLWEVSWLPGRSLDRNSAITAMVLADVTAHGEVNAGHRLRIHVEGWAAELGLTAPDVLAQISGPPGRAKTTGKTALPADPEAAG
jgi:hypothetical protein